MSRKLPVVTVAKVAAATGLLERLLDEHTDLFAGKMHAFRERYRAGSDRTLTPEEASRIAAAMTDDGDRIALAERVQASGLRAHDEPSAGEVLFAAGVATAPAFQAAALRLLALLELPNEQFAEVHDPDASGELDALLAERVRELDDLPAVDARHRMEAAFAHFAAGVGSDPGEPVRLLVASVRQAFQQAAGRLEASLTSAPSSLTGSPPSTDGGSG